VKGKIAEAIAAGLPVVTTSIGAEGMDLADGEHALIADDPARFADAVVRLHTDEELWRRIAAQAPVHLDAIMGAGVARAGIRQALATVAPARWEVSAEAEWFEDAVAHFAEQYGAGDPATLVITVPRDKPDGPAQAQARALAAIGRLERDVETLADIEITWEEG
jgi:hypothetical protein